MRRRLKKLLASDTPQTPVCDSRGNQFQRCLICLEQLNSASLRGQLPCGHVQFCHRCVQTWSHTTNKCPLCGVRYHTLKRVNMSEEGVIKELGEELIADKNFEQEIDEELLRMLEQVRCHVCGSDRDEHILLLCDYCDAGYHTTCLGMDCIPNLDVWYCDDCLQHLDKEDADQQWQQMEQVGRVRSLPPSGDRQYTNPSSTPTANRRKRLRKLETQN